MGQLIETLSYRLEGRVFDSRLTQFFRPHYDPGVDSAYNRNWYQRYFLGGKGGRCVGPTNLLLSFADFLDIWKPQPPGSPRVCPGLYRDCFTFTFHVVFIFIRAGISNLMILEDTSLLELCDLSARAKVTDVSKCEV